MHTPHLHEGWEGLAGVWSSSCHFPAVSPRPGHPPRASALHPILGLRHRCCEERKDDGKCFKSTMSRGTKDSHELGAYTHQGTWPHTPYWPRRGFTDDASDTHKVQPTSRSPSELVTERVHKPGPQCPYGCAIHLSHRQKVYDTLWCAICMALQGARSFSFYGKCLFWKGT